MKKTNPNAYSNDFLQFYIEKPADWDFLPQQWAVNLREQSFENNGELRELFMKATVPFVYINKPHEEPEYPFPTVQCSCRLNGFSSNLSFEELMEKCIEMSGKSYSELEVIEANTNFILSGYRSIFIRMSFSLMNLDNEPVPCLARIIMVITPKIIYNIGMTGSVGEKYCCEEIFKDILLSIRLGNRYFRRKNNR